MASSLTRIKKEFKDLSDGLAKKRKEVTKVIHSINLVGKDITKWSVVLKGPTESPFENGLFELSINFKAGGGNVEYPFKAPYVSFITKVYHPNVNNQGAICLDILKDQWSPALTIEKLVMCLSSLLTDPNADDPLNTTVAHQYKKDKKTYEDTVRQWVVEYATPKVEKPAEKVENKSGPTVEEVD